MSDQQKLFRAVVLAITSLVAGTFVKADTTNYVGQDGGNWNNAGNWSLSAVPGFAQFVNIFGPPGPFTVNYDYNYTKSNEPWTLTLDSRFGALTFNQSIDNTNLFTHSESIGAFGIAVFNQTTGSNNMLEVDSALNLGTTPLGNGTYNLSGGTLTVRLNEAVGALGHGNVVQSGGTNTASSVSLGNGSTGIGTYALSGGTLAAGITVESGSTFTQTGGNVAGVAPVIQSGSTFDPGKSIQVGVNSSAVAVYRMSGGTITGSPALIIANAGGNGQFLQSGGSAGLTALTVGHAGNGYYALSGNGVLNVSLYEYVGDEGTGTFDQSGGSHSVSGQIALARVGGTSGTYNLSGGSLAESVISVGSLGTGTFNQTGGTHTVSGSLAVGERQAASGTYNLAGGTLTSFEEYIGYTQGTSQSPGGRFVQTAGSNIAGTLAVGLEFGSGTYQLSDYGQPATSVLTADNEYIGFSGGKGFFTQIGGTNTLSSGINASGTAHGLYVSESDSSPQFNSGYNLINGILQSAYEAVAYADPGTFVQTGGSNTIGVQPGFPSLVIARYQTSGSYTLTGGTLSAAGNEIVGDSGNGTFNQSGGTHTVGGSLYLGNSAFGSGTFNLSGGAFTLSNDLLVANRGNGNFAQSGGSFTATGSLYLASNSGTSATFMQAGGTAAFAGSAFVGGSSTTAGGYGSMTVSGGSLTIANTLKVWNKNSSALNLTGGNLTAGMLDLDGNPSSLHWTGGILRLTNGSTHLGDLSGAGVLAVGTPTGSHAFVTASSINLSGIGVDATGKLAVAFNAAPAVSSVSTLNISGAGQFDLANGTLFIHYSGSDPVNNITAYLASGYDNGKWDGPGIISSTAADDPLHLSAIGIIDFSAKQTIELKYVMYGDTTLGGTVSSSDLAVLLQHEGTAHGATWATGDFNYDGAVNASDKELLENSLSAVPEPAAILGVGILLPLLHRRRTKQAKLLDER